MSVQNNKKRAMKPKLRFADFRNDKGWKEHLLAKFLTESRVEGSTGDVAKKITVKLWGKGVFAKDELIAGSENTKYFKRSAGQFIYSKLDFVNQAFGIITNELDGLESTVDLPCFDVGKGLNPGFLLEYVKRDDFYRRNGEIADGGRKAKRIQAEVFLAFPIALPPQESEQEKIADCLSSVDELIAAEDQKLDVLKAHRAGLMQQIFPRTGESVPRLRFPAFQRRGPWKVETLTDIATIRSGSTPSRAEPAFYNGGTIPWVKTTDLNNDFIYRTEECITHAAKARINPAGSVLVAMYGGFKQIGRTGYLTMPAANQSGPFSSECGREKVLPIYLLAWMNSRVEDWKKIAGSSRKDPNVTGTDVANFPIAYPNKDEQKEIAEVIGSLNESISAQGRRIECLREHKAGLIQQLFPAADKVGA